MTEYLYQFSLIWQSWMLLSLFLGFIGVVILIYWQKGKPQISEKFLRVGGILFAQTILTFIIGFVVFSIIESRTRVELKNYLNQENLVLTVNGKKLKKSENQELLNTIRKVVTILPHHSTPTKKIIVEIISNRDTTILSLRKDSQKEDEYWIYWNKYDPKNDIGRLKTSELRRYLPMD